MAYYVDNPFASASTRRIAEGTKFIGREYNQEEIENKLLNSEGLRGSLAIIGLPDVGKLCLINKVLLERRAELHQKKLIPIKMDLKTYTEPNKPDKFFRDLVSSCCDELEDLDFATPKIIEIAQRVLEEWDKRGGTIPPLQRFFKNVLNAGIRVIFILDNFDHADSLFKGDTAHIHWLRQLTDPDFQVTWVVLACKPIHEIETVPNSLSRDMFDERFLGMFTEDDMEVYFRSLAQVGISLSEQHKKIVMAYCGRHPYLLSLLGYHLVEEYAHQPDTTDVERVFHKVEERFHQSYERIISLVLDSDNKRRNLWQLLFGLADSVEQKDINRMLAYDLIHPNPALSSLQENTQPVYVGFSEHFQNYLRSKLPGSEPSSLLQPIEQNFRSEDPFSWSQTLPPGSLLLNRYRIQGLLGSSELNRVVKAWDTRIERFVAIKLLSLDPSEGEKMIGNAQKWLRREGTILGGLEHANISQIYDVIENPPAIVMKWIEGQSLDQLWANQVGVPPLTVAQMGRQLAQILQLIHQAGIIHRDIKPQNIILRADGEPVLIDFGSARAVGKETLLQPDAHGQSGFVGTLQYCAPEQWKNATSASFPADIYSVGVVLYEALTGGKKPYRPSSWEHPPDSRIPAVLWPLLRAMLCDDPLLRPDAQQLCLELEDCLQALEKQ